MPYENNITIYIACHPKISLEDAWEQIKHYGKVKNGWRPLLQILLWLKELNSKTYLASIPLKIQNVLSTILTPVAKLRGYQVAYKRFSGVDVK